MRYTALVAVMTLGFVAVGCNSSTGDDPANMTKAPAAASGATAPPPNLNKKMPGMGGPSSMGGGPTGGGQMSSKPATKPPGQ